MMVTWALPDGLRIEPRRAGAVAVGLRRAVMGRLPDPLPPEVSGHDAEDSPHVAYLPLLDAGSDRSSGQVVGLGVLAPPGRPELVELLRGSLLPGFPLMFRGTRLQLRPPRPGVRALDPAAWSAPARLWATATPIVLDRFSGRGNESAEISRACVHMGLPEPVAVATSRAPELPGAADLRPGDLPRRDNRPYTHATLEFPDPVTGPVLLGSQRYLGMGLCHPVKA